MKIFTQNRANFIFMFFATLAMLIVYLYEHERFDFVVVSLFLQLLYFIYLIDLDKKLRKNAEQLRDTDNVNKITPDNAINLNIPGIMVMLNFIILSINDSDNNSIIRIILGISSFSFLLISIFWEIGNRIRISKFNKKI